MWVLGDKQNGSAQGSFPKRMHGRVFFETDARNPNVHFDGCVERTFGQRICARYGANPGCAQPISRMQATPLTNNPWEWSHTESGTFTCVTQRQRHRPRTCQSMANTLQVDGLARITGLTQAPHKTHPQPLKWPPPTPYHSVVGGD